MMAQVFQRQFIEFMRNQPHPPYANGAAGNALQQLALVANENVPQQAAMIDPQQAQIIIGLHQQMARINALQN